MSGFQLDMSCVEKEEERSDFLSSCGRLDGRTLHHLLESKHVDANVVDSVGQNGVHYVVGSCQHEVEKQLQLLRLLVQGHGANVNAARTTDGWTPVYLAVIFGLAPLVSTLLQMGAKTTVKDLQGMTPEDWADKYRLAHIKNLLVHNRSKVPHSRFSCVQRGPALEPTSPSSSITSTEDASTSSSSSSSSVPADSSLPSLGDSANGMVAKEAAPTANEACLLTAQ